MVFNPSDNEDGYFKQKELARLREKRAADVHGTAQKEREELKRLHWMRCPKCGMQLDEVSFKGVRVDACFSCGGMFLDEGEVDKILTHEEPGFFSQIFGAMFGAEKREEEEGS